MGNAVLALSSHSKSHCGKETRDGIQNEEVRNTPGDYRVDAGRGRGCTASAEIAAQVKIGDRVNDSPLGDRFLERQRNWESEKFSSEPGHLKVD